MEHELTIATYVIASSTMGVVISSAWYNSRLIKNSKNQSELTKKHMRFLAMLEIMKIFNEPEKAKERHVVYTANQQNVLYKENGDIRESFSEGMGFHNLPMYVASTRGTFDQMGKLVIEGYVDKEEFLHMYFDPVIRMGKVLRRNILYEREQRKSDHFMINFECIFNDARLYWEKNFPGQSEPEPF